MPRHARLDSPGTLQHVMIRGIEGSKIFRDDEDRKDFVFRLGELTEKTKTRILAWSVLDNHVHLLFFSGPEGIAAVMRRLLTGYSIRFNRRHRRTGHLFQNRYKSIVCEEGPYLLELVRYIHLNPLRAKIVKDLRELDRFAWSGHSVLMGKRENEWQERDYVLGHFGRRQSKAIATYRKFMGEGIGQGRRPDLVGGGLIRSMGGWSRVISLRKSGERAEHDERVLGSGDFVTSILAETESRFKRQMGIRKDDDTIDRIITKACTQAGIRQEELRFGGKRREVSKVRGEIAYRLNRELGLSLAEIARRLGVGTSAIGMAIARVAENK